MRPFFQAAQNHDSCILNRSMRAIFPLKKGITLLDSIFPEENHVTGDPRRAFLSKCTWMSPRNLACQVPVEACYRVSHQLTSLLTVIFISQLPLTHVILFRRKRDFHQAKKRRHVILIRKYRDFHQILAS